MAAAVSLPPPPVNTTGAVVTTTGKHHLRRGCHIVVGAPACRARRAQLDSLVANTNTEVANEVMALRAMGAASRRPYGRWWQSPSALRTQPRRRGRAARLALGCRQRPLIGTFLGRTQQAAG